MSKFTSIEELFNTAEQSVGPPTEGGDGNPQLRVFQPDRGIDVTYNNPNFTGQSDTPTSTQVLQERDNRQTLGTVTLNNRDYWENSNFDESIFQSYVKGKIETTLNTRPIIDGNEEEIVFNESFDVSSTYRYSIDALPFVTDVNNDDEIIRLDRYYDKEINPTEYNLATEGKINYYLYPRTSGRTPSHNIETYGSKQKFTGGGGKNRFDFYVSQSVSLEREDTGYYLFRLDWGDGSPREHTSELKLLEGTTLLEHFYEKPGFYSITGLVCAIYEGRIIGGYERFQTNILLNPSRSYELKLYDFSNFATIGGLSSDSSLVKSTANIMGLNPLTLNQENENATPKLIEKLNLLDRLIIFNFLNKINSELNNNFTTFLNPYSIEISDTTEQLIETIGGNYNVTLNEESEGDDDLINFGFGDVYSSFIEGEVIELLVSFVEGYNDVQLRPFITTPTNLEIQLVEQTNNNARYQFIMPTSDVEITATAFLYSFEVNLTSTAPLGNTQAYADGSQINGNNPTIPYEVLINDNVQIVLNATPIQNEGMGESIFQNWQIISDENFENNTIQLSSLNTPQTILTINKDADSNNFGTIEIKANFFENEVDTGSDDTGGNSGVGRRQTSGVGRRQTSGAGRRKRGEDGRTGTYEGDDLVDPTGAGF
tara:strand:- start:244 stop:2208 length:1965 start_codon:yes stop_codon:yes gene_type:complete